MIKNELTITKLPTKNTIPPKTNKKPHKKITNKFISTTSFTT